jgi:hypothetical protein
LVSPGFRGFPEFEGLASLAEKLDGFIVDSER